MANTTATPQILTDAGFLFWSPLGTAEPAHTAAGSIYTDAWPVAWVNLGATEDGSEFAYEVSVEPISVAEFYDPVKQVVTERNGSIAFNLASYTATNLKKALNGATNTVTGTGATTSTRVTPPVVGSEVRCMIGWESLDQTSRFIAFQTLNAASINSAFKKAPDIAVLPCEFRFEVPTSGIPFAFQFAGTARA